MAGVLGLDFDANNPNNGDGPRLLGWANDAVVDMLRRTHCYVASASMTATAGVGDYSLDSSIIEILDIYTTSSDTNFRLQRLSPTALINLRLFSVTSSPEKYWALQGANLLMLYPSPLESDSITVYYVPRPNALFSPTDDPSDNTLGGIPPEFHPGLELYMQWKAGDAFDDESSSSGETYRRQYLGDPTAPPGTAVREGFIGEMRKDLQRKGGRHMAPAQIPPRARRIYIPNPGVDTGSLYN